MRDMIEVVALVASIVLPLFNIPLIRRIIQRRSSEDISLVWVLGVWTCLLLMFPSGVLSDQIVWRAFNYANLSLFTVVLVVVWRYRKRRDVKENE